jgi:hypothetical protein
VVAPVAEGNIARDTQIESQNAETRREGSEATEAQELQAKAQKADT